MSQETYISATKPNRLMPFGETVAAYCENHTEHTDTVRTWQETHCHHYKAQPANTVWGNSHCLLWESYRTHRYSSYLLGNTLRLRYKDQPVNAV
jgi:hypothetical protein